MLDNISYIVGFLKNGVGTWQGAVKALAAIISEAVDLLGGEAAPPHALMSGPAVKDTVLAALEPGDDGKAKAINWGTLLPLLVTLLQQILSNKSA